MLTKFRSSFAARTLLSAAAASTLVVAASGCLVVSGKSVDERGTLITQNTLHQIEPGVTTEAWLVATLGEPECRTTVDAEPGVSVLRYTYEQMRSSGGAVFLIFAGGSESTHSTTTYFEIVDGYVTRYWTESSRK